MVRAVRLGNVVIGAGEMKIIVPITPTDQEEAISQAAIASESGADIVEWRVDYLHDVSIEAVCHIAAILTTRVKQPILATFRTSAEGGRAIGDDDYVRLLSTLISTGSIDAIDVEFFRGTDTFTPAKPITEILEFARERGIPTVASYHDFSTAPPRAESLARLGAMADAGADIAKFACMPQNALDVAELFVTSAEAAERLAPPLIMLAMGSIGAVSRAAGHIFGSAATFAMVGEATAPGQMPISELRPVVAALEHWSEPAGHKKPRTSA
ncbi:MAG: type I 3-dehydroquinate dehydratase [Ancrocorticia sp.]|nr:type I 3-dehydroquinate dehydratase [Ancrocorticia sp.]